MSRIVSLADVCLATTSNIAKKNLANNIGNYPIYGASGFIKNVDFYKQDTPYIAIVKDGAGVGRVSLMPEKSSVIGTMQYIIPNNSVDRNFLYYVLVKLNLSRYYTGATIPHIYFKDYKKERFSLPSLDEQRKIAALLDKINELIAGRKQQLEQLNLMLKSRFIEMFGSLRTPKWEMKRLDTIASTRLGKMLDAKRQTGVCTYPYLANFNVQWFSFNLERLNEMDFNEADRKEFSLEDGDLLICEGGEVGRTAIWRRERTDCYFQKALHRVRCNPEICVPEYIAWVMYFKAKSGQFDGIATSATIAHLTGIKLKAIMFPIPPLPLQNAFADFVRQLDKSKFEIQQGLKKLELQYNALMQHYFG